MGAKSNRQGGRIMKRCMIVDDSSVIRKVAKRILSSPQLLVSEASSATEAIYMWAKPTCRT